MLNFPTPKELALLREKYPPGTRVELVRMDDDPFSKLKPGDRGTVRLIDDAAGVHTNWDNGESIAAIWKVDEIKPVEQDFTCLNCGHQFRSGIFTDELGSHTVCPACGGSFDVTEASAPSRITEEIISQIMDIRSSGACNMLDYRAVQREAFARNFYALVNLIETAPKVYAHFIFNGA